MEKKLGTFAVAGAYIATIIGAGFASGQEVLQFFSFFGYWGVSALLLATALFAFFGYRILILARQLDAKSYYPVIHYTTGPYVGALIDKVITFFLFGGLTVMLAGSGAIFLEQYGLPKLSGNIFMAIITLLTVLAGVHGIVNSFNLLVPVLVMTIGAIGIWAYMAHGMAIPLTNLAGLGDPAVPYWWLSAIVYVSYNIVIAVAVLAPLGREVVGIAELKRGAIWGGLGLGATAGAILLALWSIFPQITEVSIPMLTVAGSLSPALQLGYSLVLLAAVYTTAVASLYGFVARVISFENKRMKYWAIGATLVALVGSQFGFTTLVRVLYPAVGYAGILFLGGMVLVSLKERYGPRLSFKKRNRK